MCLGHDADAAICGIDQESCHRDLCARMEVDFGLLDIDELTGTGSSQGDHDGQRLRDAETHVGDADEVVSATLLGTRHAPDPKLDLSVVHPFRLDLPGQAEHLEVVAELF